MMHQSIATIDSPEFINLQPLEINPLMSSCEIKVLYLGKNRNHTYITKEVATEMAKTLRGAPIVGYYKEENEDFVEHSERIIFDDEGIKFECLTKPYGFVSPDAKVWFQKFEDTDEFGNIETREYLMTTGYLWTSQFEECQRVIDKGNNQSMELDPETLDGHWSIDSNTNMEFFIINDAIFSKLCILGEDVEPCFEGARITAPEVSTSFSKIDDNFKNTLYTMMQELKFALEGGQNMVLEEEKTVETEVTTETPVVEDVATEVEETVVEEENSSENDNSEQSTSTENQDSIEATQSNPEENFAKSDDEEKDKEDDSKDDADDTEDKDEEEDDKKKEKAGTKNSLELEEELKTLKSAYSDLEKKYQELVSFKEAIDGEKKDALISSFYMLSDEDKKDVIENKSKYSLEEIEAKLSVICFRKKVNFDLEDNSKNEEKVEDKEKDILTYNLSGEEDTSIPAWIAAVKNTRDSK